MTSNASAKALATLWICLALGVNAPAQAVELTGSIAGEYRHFVHDSPFTEADKQQASIAFAPELFYEWAEGDQNLVFVPFLRVDSEDSERTHTDIRELRWLYVADDWELRVGVDKVFWGVTESQHLVDVINQTDLVENTDTEDKLGQPMFNLSIYKDWGTLELFVMPYFRERTFAGKEGRLRANLVVDTNNAQYESGAKQHHLDVALRWAQSFGHWDLGLSHFYGTNREPLLRLNNTFDKLIPYYEIMHQTGLALQHTGDNMLWKLEIIRRETSSETFTALTGGFEYTFYGLFDSGYDVGVLAEYLFDDRNNALATPFEDDLLLGTRITWNDEQSTELLVGIIQDLNNSEHSWNIEASRRIGQRWKASVEGRFFNQGQKSSALYAFRDDDYIQLELARYF
jgi:hypothetical protein